jgi:methionine salvage enolase-phosphatase E1
MQSKEELKKELHLLIDKIDDDAILNVLMEDIVPYAVKRKVDILDELSEEQQKDLELSIKESENGDNYSMEEFIKITERWHKAS